MKKIAYLLLCVIALESCNIATSSDYNNAAKDLCECTSESSNKISEEFRKNFIEASKNSTSMENTMEKVTQSASNSEPMQLMQDGMEMIAFSEKMQTCLKKIEPKYKDLKTTDNESEVIEKLVEAFEKQNNCEFLTAVMKLSQMERAGK